MSVYYYVASKEELLDLLVDVVFEEIDLPDSEGPWRDEMPRRTMSTRTTLKKHQWAVGLFESRTRPGPATLQHHELVLACLRNAGFSLALTAHAYALLDSSTYGFALQEAGLPFEGPESVGEVAEPIMALMATWAFPTMVDVAMTYYMRPGYDFGDEFKWGLDLLLEGLEQRLSSHGPATGQLPAAVSAS